MARAIRESRSSFVLASALAASAVHERILLAYLLGFLFKVLETPGPLRLRATTLLAVDLALFVAALVYVRADGARPSTAKAFVARAIVPGVLLGSFFQLNVLLPAARGPSWDARLLGLDVLLFGYEPATSWDRWVTPTTTEWFAFFYFSYFVLLAVHVIPMMLVERRVDVVGEFTLGMVVVYCIGQLLYVFVPGFGPYKMLTFTHELSGPLWWPLVQRGAGAIDEMDRTDIFPSLHTAGPVFLTLFSFRHRRRAPFRATWPIVGFFTSQIVIATMFLRWHYLIDVVAGVALSVMALKVATRFCAEERRRELLGLAPVWPPLR